MASGAPTGWLCLIIALIAATASICRADQPIGLTLGAAFWYGIPSGTIRVTEGGRPGSGRDIDLADDLDLGAGRLPQGFIAGFVGRHRFSVAFEPLAFDGVATARRPLEFHGAAIAAGSRLRSDVAM